MGGERLDPLPVEGVRLGMRVQEGVPLTPEGELPRLEVRALPLLFAGQVLVVDDFGLRKLTAQQSSD